ncbi:MAG: hypothetical protein QG635_661, partial [Bacteroidota bacterium]|nr:hypothetical protein [Bacteroidota bacterium]
MSNIHNSRNISVFNDKYPDCHNPDEIDNILNQSELLTDENILLSDFADLDRIYGLLEYLHKFSGLSLSIIDNTGNIILSAGNQDICINYHSKHSEACNSYIDRNNYLLNYPIENNHIEYKCKNGLNYIAYPIFIENKEIALIFFGQFLY